MELLLLIHIFTVFRNVFFGITLGLTSSECCFPVLKQTENVHILAWNLCNFIFLP